MIYINLDQPYEEALMSLKRFYAEKANQAMVEHLIRAEALRLGVWPQGAPPSILPEGDSKVTAPMG